MGLFNEFDQLKVIWSHRSITYAVTKCISNLVILFIEIILLNLCKSIDEKPKILMIFSTTVPLHVNGQRIYLHSF